MVEKYEYLIKTDIHYSFEILEYLKSVWLPHYGKIREEWQVDPIMKGNKRLRVEISTGGWSENETILEALMSNEWFVRMWHYSWKRGGHNVFIIDPYSIGYMSITKMVESSGFCRQAIHKNAKKFDRLKIGRNFLYRYKTT